MTQPAPALIPGDILPPISLPEAGGDSVDLFHQSLAGLHCLLILGHPPGAEVLQQAQAEAAARGARVFLVQRGQPDGAARRDGAPQRLFDPEGRLFALVGLPEGGVATITPRGRLGFARAGEAALAAALALLPEGAGVPAGEAASAGAPVLLVPDVLEAAFRAELLAHWQKGEKARDRVASAAGAGVAQGIKRRTDVWLDDRALYATFRQRLERRVLPELWRAFRFRAASFEAPRIGCYDAADAGGFGAHRDNRTPFTAHRRFAMSLNLNTGDYRGGELWFPEYGAQRYAPPAGGAVLFCCDLLHEALPVVEGQRFAIFTFLTDAAGAQQEQALIAQRQAAGEKGVSMR
jgi:predicted 2-oxoglutarate/Fe(II)-dependent dioxygenase YbiX